MERLTISVFACCISLAASTQSIAQNAGQAIASSDVLSQISMFSYREGPKSDLNFRGTPIAANAFGTPKSSTKRATRGFRPKWTISGTGNVGPYTTYVLWALTPDGRAANKASSPDTKAKKVRSKPNTARRSSR